MGFTTLDVPASCASERLFLARRCSPGYEKSTIRIKKKRFKSIRKKNCLVIEIVEPPGFSLFWLKFLFYVVKNVHLSKGS